MPATVGTARADGVDADVEQDGVAAELILDDVHDERVFQQGSEGDILVDEVEDPLRAATVELGRDVDEADAHVLVRNRPRGVELVALLEQLALRQTASLVVVEVPDPRVPLAHLCRWLRTIRAGVVPVRASSSSRRWTRC